MNAMLADMLRLSAELTSDAIWVPEDTIGTPDYNTVERCPKTGYVQLLGNANGVMDKETFISKAHLERVCFINHEPYLSGEMYNSDDRGGYDQAHQYWDVIRQDGLEGLDYQEAKLYRNIAKTAFVLLKETDWEDKDDQYEIAAKLLMENVCVINMNHFPAMPGAKGKKANMKRILQWLKPNSGLLRRQIDLYNPAVILGDIQRLYSGNGTEGYILGEKVKVFGWQKVKDDFCSEVWNKDVWYNDSRIWMGFPHPSARISLIKWQDWRKTALSIYQWWRAAIY